MAASPSRRRDAPGTQGGGGAARRRFQHALDNSLVAPAAGGSLPLGQALHAFTTKERDPWDEARVGGSAALAAFQASHPGLQPVLTLADADARYVLYDAALHGPALPAPGPYSLAGGTVGSVVVQGSAASGAFLVDGGRTGLASAGGLPGFQTLGAAGSGTLILKPLFAKGAAAAPGAHEVQGVKQHPEEDCLTCVDDRPCHVVYKLTAPVGFTDLAVRAFPRLYGDWRLRNSWRVSVSTDGRTYEELDRFRSNVSGRWDGWRVPRTSRKVWALPARDVYLRFDLSGDGVQLWSSPEFPLLIEAGFDGARAEFPLEPFALAVEGTDGTFQPLTVPARSFNHLLRPY